MSERVREELPQLFAAVAELEGQDLEILGWRAPGGAMRLLRPAMRKPRRTTRRP